MTKRCFSENHAFIMQAVQLSTSDNNLIGDFSKHYVLPLLNDRKHQDLKSISAQIVADLLQGKYNDVVDSFQIIDCRFPYEYEGGHIRSAINLYTQEHILTQFIRNRSINTLSSTVTSPNKQKKLMELQANDETSTTTTNQSSTGLEKRKILIFHCEFSSERGPGL